MDFQSGHPWGVKWGLVHPHSSVKPKNSCHLIKSFVLNRSIHIYNYINHMFRSSPMFVIQWSLSVSIILNHPFPSLVWYLLTLLVFFGEISQLEVLVGYISFGAIEIRKNSIRVRILGNKQTFPSNPSYDHHVTIKSKNSFSFLSLYFCPSLLPNAECIMPNVGSREAIWHISLLWGLLGMILSLGRSLKFVLLSIYFQ